MMQKPAPFDAVNFCHLQKYELAAQASCFPGKRKKEKRKNILQRLAIQKQN